MAGIEIPTGFQAVANLLERPFHAAAFFAFLLGDACFEFTGQLFQLFRSGHGYTFLSRSGCYTRNADFPAPDQAADENPRAVFGYLVLKGNEWTLSMAGPLSVQVREDQQRDAENGCAVKGPAIQFTG
jgi:hypothetical protein